MAADCSAPLPQSRWRSDAVVVVAVGEHVSTRLPRSVGDIYTTAIPLDSLLIRHRTCLCQNEVLLLVRTVPYGQYSHTHKTRMKLQLALTHADSFTKSLYL